MQAVDRVDAWMINHISYTEDEDAHFGSGTYRHLGGRRWLLDTRDRWGEPTTMALREVLRDDWSVTLTQDGSLTTHIDTFKRTVTNIDRYGTRQKLGAIEAATISTGGEYLTWIEVEKPDGGLISFRNVLDGRWEATCDDGRTPVIVCDVEVGRSPNRIEIRESTRGIRVVFDLRAATVTVTDGGTVLPPTGTITAMGVPGPSSYEAGEPAVLTVTNPTHLELDVLWVDYLGHEIPRRRIAPGQDWVTPSFTGHLWMVRDVASRRRIHAGFLTESATVVASTADVRPVGGPPVQTTVKNLYTEPVDVSWVAPDASESPLGSLVPGGHLGVSGSAGDVLRVRSGGADLGHLLIGTDPIQYRPVVRGPLRAPDATTTFRNKSPLRVALGLRHDSGETRYHRMDPGEVLTQPTVAGETWVARDVDSDRVLLEVTASAQDGEAIITSMAVRPPAPSLGDGSRTLSRRFRNTAADTGAALDGSELGAIVYRVDEDGHDTAGHLVPPGEEYVVDTVPGDVWRAREPITRREIGLWVIGRHGPTELPIAVRSTHSRVPVRLAIENRTMLTAEVLWMDGNGRAQPRGVLAPWSSLHVDTHATHMWVLRDRVSGLILDVHRVYLDEPTMLLDATDLVRLRGKDPLAVDIHNQAGFGFDVVDLADPTGSALATIEPDEEVQVQGHPGLALGMRDRAGGGVFATHVCVPSDTRLAVRPQGLTSGAPTRVHLFNDSTLELNVYCWRDGVESDIRRLDPRQSATLDTISGSVWLVREAVSGVVLTCALATGTPRRIRITGEHPQPPDPIAVHLDLTNRSSVTVDIRAVATDGTETHVGTMAPGGTTSMASTFAATTRFLLQGTDLEVDRCITGEESPMVFEVANNLFADSVDPGGLRPGEVALYPGADFAGAPRVAHCSIASLHAAGIGSVGSLRVGPATGVIVTRPGTQPPGAAEPDPQTPDDVFTSDVPRLADTDVGTLMDSMEIFTVAESSRHSLEIGTSLTTVTRRTSAADPARPPLTRLAHRCMIRFDTSVTSVQVWASSQMTAYVGDTAHLLSPTTPTTLRPTSGGTLSIAVDADTLGAPSLMLRTNVMPLRHRFFIYPDGAAMKSLRDQPDDLLSSHATDLGINPTALGADAAARQNASTQVMTSLRQLASAAPGATPVDGARHEPSPHRMDYDAWSLDRRDGTQFTPLAPSQLSAMGEGDNAEITHAEDLFAAFDRLIVQPVAASTQIAFTSLDRLGRDAVLTLEQAENAVTTTILEPVLRTIDDVIVQPALAAAAEGLAALGQAVDGAGELLATMAAEAAQTLSTIADLVLAVTIQQGERLSRVILDTAEKVGAVVTAVLEEIGAAIASVAQWLASLFDWEAIKATHALIVDDLTPQLMGKLDAWLGLLGGQVSTATTQSSAAVRAALTGVGDLLDAIPPPPRSPKGADAPSGESTDSFLDRLFAEIDAGTVELGATTNAPDLSDLEPQATALLEQLGAAVSGVLETIVAGVGAAASSPPEELGRRVLGLLVESMATITDAIFAIVDGVAQLAITLLGRVSAAIHEALTVPLHVPILSDLYCANLDRPHMTPLGLTALLVAVPATAVGRGAQGDEWPPTDIELSTSTLTLLKCAIGGGTYLGGTVISPIRLAVPDPPPLRGLLLAVDVTMSVIPFLAELPDPADTTHDSLDDNLGTFADFFAALVVCMNLTSAWVTYTGLGRGVPVARRQRRAAGSRRLNTFSSWVGVVSGVASVVSDFDRLVRDPTASNQLTVIHGELAQLIMLSNLLGTAGDGPPSPWDPRLITEMVLTGAGNLGAGITMAMSLDA